MVQPVFPAVLGRGVMVIHLLVVVMIVLFFSVLAVVTRKQPFFKDQTEPLRQLELAAFAKRFQGNFKDPFSSQGDKELLVRTVLDHLNQIEPNTQLSIPPNQYTLSRFKLFVSSHFALSIHGHYHAKAVDYSYKTRYSRLGAWASTTVTLTLPVAFTALPITITERHPAWKNLQCQTIQECFDQRFQLQGIASKQIPTELQTILVNFPHNVDLTLSGNALQYTNKYYDYRGSLYSLQGMILLIDWCDQVSPLALKHPVNSNGITV